MSRIIEKYCGFHRNDTLLKRHDSFLLKLKTWLCFNAIRITTDARRFCCWLVLFLGF
ncbi:hypothetical protein HPCPY6081_1594 [Helicobacter pylori CPY6081]|nr:hypothetical protein HPCPY6081_1594 [Helicobacter pylori CPY6081]